MELQLKGNTMKRLLILNKYTFYIVLEDAFGLLSSETVQWKEKKIIV